jgi:hypothetical protein
MEHDFEGVGEPRSKEIVEGGLERKIPDWVSTQEGETKSQPIHADHYPLDDFIVVFNHTSKIHGGIFSSGSM